MPALRPAEIDRIVIRGLHVDYPGLVSEDRIASHFKLPVEDVHSSLLRLRRLRIARDRRLNGERVWGAW